MIYDAIIIGGGPAGLAAAMILKNKNVLLLEKNSELGKKLLISGAGQCNLTHGGPLEAYEGHYGGKWRFIRSAMMSYTPDMLLNDLGKQGLSFVTREDLKVFPSTLQAQDVLNGFIQGSKGVKIQTRAEVIQIEKKAVWAVKTNQATYQGKYLIVATGGMTYQGTGSTGDAYQFAKALAVPLETPQFALAPIYVRDYEMASIKGISFSNIGISHYRQKKIGDYKGDLLLTHFGLSGPLILNNSRYMQKGDILYVNFIDMSPKDLEDQLIRFSQEHSKKQVKSFFNTIQVPNRLVDFMFQTLEIAGDLKTAELSKKTRKDMITFLTDHAFEIASVGKAHIAMVTKGGISLKALKSKSFAWKKDESLHFVGECIDVDGDTGGYNIQFAVSSGVAAAKHILEGLDEEM